MSKTNWKKLQNPDYLGAYSLQDDNGKNFEMTLTIKSVRSEEVKGPEGKEECIVLRFAENVKPMVLNATNAKIITKLYKSPFIEDWSGCKIIVYVEKVKAFGDVVDALRIRQKIPTQAVPISLKCSDCPDDITGFENMTAEQVALRNQQKYGRPLCIDCAAKLKSRGEEQQ
ncbi:MAG: hypothetical protein ABFD25_00760 [Clostridiaceae bacterium]